MEEISQFSGDYKEKSILSDSFEDYLKHLSTFLKFDNPEKWLLPNSADSSTEGSLLSLSENESENCNTPNSHSIPISDFSNFCIKLQNNEVPHILNNSSSDEDDDNVDNDNNNGYHLSSHTLRSSRRLSLILENNSDCDTSVASILSSQVPENESSSLYTENGGRKCENIAEGKDKEEVLSSADDKSESFCKKGRRLTCEEFVSHLYSARESCSQSMELQKDFTDDENDEDLDYKTARNNENTLKFSALEEKNSEESDKNLKNNNENGALIDANIEKNKKKRAKVIEELFATEVTYMKHLDLVVSLFIDPLTTSKLLPESVIGEIFGNIQMIMSVNMELSSHMHMETIGQAFLHMAHYLKLYSTYAQNHERALAILLEWDQKSSDFSRFRRQQEELPEMNGLKLNALLITPVQRIPRYKLLLEELLSCTPQEHNDYLAIKEAVVQIQQVASHINDHIKKQDNFMKMLAIQKCFNSTHGPRILIPGRMFIKEGPLRKVSKQGNKSHERLFFLFSDMLMYAKPRFLDSTPSNNNNNNNNGNVKKNNNNNNVNVYTNMNYHSLICCCMLPLHHCQVEQVLGGKNQGQGALFNITCKKEQLLLFSDQETVDSWLNVLNKQIEVVKSNRQTLRKRSSAQQPIRNEGFMKFLKKKNKENVDRNNPEKIKQAKKHADKFINKQQTKQQTTHNNSNKTSATTTTSHGLKKHVVANTQQTTPKKHFTSGLACLRKTIRKKMQDQGTLVNEKPKVFADLTIVEENHGIFAGNNVTLNDTIDIMSAQKNVIKNNILDGRSKGLSDKNGDNAHHKDTHNPLAIKSFGILSTQKNAKINVSKIDEDTKLKTKTFDSPRHTPTNNKLNTPIMKIKTPINKSSTPKNKLNLPIINKINTPVTVINSPVNQINTPTNKRQSQVQSPIRPVSADVNVINSKNVRLVDSACLVGNVTPLRQSQILSATEKRTPKSDSCKLSKNLFAFQRNNYYGSLKHNNENSGSKSQKVDLAIESEGNKTPNSSGERRSEIKTNIQKTSTLTVKVSPVSKNKNIIHQKSSISKRVKLTTPPSPILPTNNNVTLISNIAPSCNSPTIIKTNPQGTNQPNSNNKPVGPTNPLEDYCTSDGEVENNSPKNNNNNNGYNNCDADSLNISPCLSDDNVVRNITLRKRSKLIRSSTLIERVDYPRNSADSGWCSDIVVVDEGRDGQNLIATAAETNTDVMYDDNDNGGRDGDQFQDGFNIDNNDRSMDGGNNLDVDFEGCLLRNLSFRKALSEF